MESLTSSITFQSSEELQDFLKQLKPKEKKLKKENDKRGSQTKTLHILAKEYKEENNRNDENSQKTEIKQTTSE